MSLRKNVASQVITFALVNATTGAALTGATVTTKVTLDGTQSSGAGTVTELGTGQYKYVPTQGETNGTTAGFCFTATNAVPVNLHCFITAGDPTDAVRGGLTALPNAAAGANGGLPLSVDASGRVDVLKINGTSQTARDIGASVLLSSGTGTGQVTLTSGRVNADLTHISAVAVSTSTAQLGVNVVNAAGTAWGSGAITAASIAASALNGKGDWNVGKTGYTLTQAFPTNFSSLGINASGHISRVTLADTITTYTGNTVQTGDSYARIGATGSGLTSLAPSATALSTAQWSNTRAGYLDNLSGGAVALASGVTVAANGLANVTAWTVDITGSLSGSVGSVAGNVDGSVGSVYGNVLGSVEGSVGSVINTVDTDVQSIAGLTIANVENMATRFLGMIELDSTVYRYTTNALEQAPAGGGGGGGTDWTTSEKSAFRTILGFDGSGVVSTPTSGALYDIKTKTDTIGNGDYTAVSPVAEDGETVTIRRGDDYLLAIGTQIPFTFSGLSFSLVSATVTFRVANGSEWTMTVTSATAAYLERTATQTLDLNPGKHNFEIDATLSGGQKRTLATGELTIESQV